MSPSPLPPLSQASLHKNTPLAPSQEVAYRQKCIDLRRRLNEITQNNDVMRSRIARERAAHDKMRLNRAILLHHLKNVIDGKPLNEAEAEAFRQNGPDGNLSTSMGYDEQMTGIDGNARSAYLDEETENSDDDEIPEPQERPLRSKRSNKYNTETSMNLPSSSAAATPNHHPLNGSAYGSAPASLPQLLPAHRTSPGPHHPENLPSSFQSATPGMGSTPIQPPVGVQPPSVYPPYQSTHEHSPSASRAAIPGTFYDPHRDIQYQTGPETQRPANAPDHPLAPREAFEAQQRAEALAHRLPDDEALSAHIEQQWRSLSDVDRRQWDEKYRQEMIAYENENDQYKRANRASGGGGSGAGGGGFRAVNQ